MTKLKEAQESIEVLAGQLAAVQMLLECVLVEGIKTKTLNEQTFAQIFDQGMLAFQNNKNMKQEYHSNASTNIHLRLELSKSNF